MTMGTILLDDERNWTLDGYYKHSEDGNFGVSSFKFDATCDHITVGSRMLL